MIQTPGQDLESVVCIEHWRGDLGLVPEFPAGDHHLIHRQSMGAVTVCSHGTSENLSHVAGFFPLALLRGPPNALGTGS